MVGVELFKELMNKPIGLLFFMEEYPRTAGGTGWKAIISGAFDKDGFTATEIQNKSTSAALLDKMVAALKDRPIPGVKTAVEQTSNGTTHAFSNMDEDIPF